MKPGWVGQIAVILVSGKRLPGPRPGANVTIHESTDLHSESFGDMVPTFIRKHPILLGIATVFLCLVLLIAYSMAATRWPWVFYWSEVKEANKIISAVDSFRAKHNYLPETLTEAGIDESGSGRVYYMKSADNAYIVWFGTVLGESATYESATKKWH
jgi:hypothetical protein